MKLRHIEIINAVLQTGSLSAAARLLKISQPSATKHLQHAESTLGYALFRRHAGRLHPTQELTQLAPAIRAAYVGFDEVRRTAVNLRERPQARLRVGIVPSLAAMIPDAYAAMRQRHPDVHCEFSTGYHYELLQSLLLREIDVGIAFDPPNHPALTFEEVGHCTLVCAARPELLGKFRRASTIEARYLATMPLIDLVNTDPVGRLVGSYAERYGWQYPAGVVVKTHRMALELAAKALGVAVVDSISAERFQPALTVLPLEPVAHISLQAMFLQPGALSAAAVRFIQSFRQSAAGS